MRNKMFMGRWLGSGLTLCLIGISVLVAIVGLAGLIGRFSSFAILEFISSSVSADAHSLILGADIAVIVALFLHLSALNSRASGVVYNLSMESQIERISWVINSCECDLVIFSGKFKSEVYEHPMVLAALRGLSSQSVRLYARDEKVDQLSVKFLSMCKEKNWEIVHSVGSKQAHFIVVDGMDCRIEFPADGDSGDQFAVYYAGRPDFCRRLQGSFRENVLRRNPDFDRSKLPNVRLADV